ncbi:MAG TPA: helix-turn-helix domain-containing protein [Chitinophagaceae bacterium]|nr:helix-turn-helix domain-containing protein [Chitinophagaceae bacterium]
MSSNIRIKKVCEHCGDIFMAKTTTTRYCSHRCNSAAYKKKEKQDKIEQSNQQTKNKILHQQEVIQPEITVSKELVNVKELSVITSLSERTLFRLVKDEKFPKMKIGKRLVFNKDAVINYLNFKYGSA